MPNLLNTPITPVVAVGSASTFNIADPNLLTSLTRSLGDAQRLLSEDEALYSQNQTTFYAQRGNWLSTPPAQVWVDGVLAAGSAYTAPGDGTVVFTSPVTSGSMVTASYWFDYFTTDDLTDFIYTGLSAVEGALGAASMLTDTMLPRSLKGPILKVAHIYALQALVTGNLDNYMWKVEGRVVDKRGVSPSFLNAIKLYTQSLETDLAWLRPQFQAEGESVLLNIDIQLPPNKFSTFNVGDTVSGDISTN